MRVTFAEARSAYSALQAIGGADTAGRLRYPLPPAAHARVLSLLRALRGPVEDSDAVLEAVTAEHRDPERRDVDGGVPIRDALAYRRAVTEAMRTEVEIDALPLTQELLGEAAAAIPPALLAELGPLYELAEG